ncbi:MAG: short-chain dehydrogenase/reductase SDR [Candidatus Berkelbacteria bacterium Athens1014_28]|uniref:Short-chain dehydrogenase/reductase SDR n=1 Tax=Candidatus Berkelbacteria bacterium Athens1014_28 TaxID=2017145 RepID=A0A554LPC5_9BACT|nr:MAG: short-chain dehydrogenase/reductase SDR [Candidatus Berkelbacteria bacterium Athens1014_28]
MRLKDKVAIVTGAGSGIGKASAILFAKEGAKVVVADWSEEGGQKTVEEIKTAGGEAIFIKTDVSKSADIDAMVSKCVEIFGKLDILFNNAGVVSMGKVEATTEEEWQKVIDVDLKGVFLGAKRAIPEMEKTGRGKIISTASIAGLVGFDGVAAYCAAKGGVVNLTRELALECAPKKINVNAIAPGVIETAMTKDILADPEQKKGMEMMTPYPRLGLPDDIAYAALYLASDESDFVTGHTLVVDGGWIAK